MWQRLEQDGFEELFIAGEKVLPGVYRQVGGNREVTLDREDILPASLDGQVACYTCVRNMWGQRLKQNDLTV